MPHQNLDSEIMLALAIWLLAIFVFLIMLVIVFAAWLSENRSKIEYRPKADLQTMEQIPSQSAEIVSVKETE